MPKRKPKSASIIIAESEHRINKAYEKLAKAMDGSRLRLTPAEWSSVFVSLMRSAVNAGLNRQRDEELADAEA